MIKIFHSNIEVEIFVCNEIMCKPEFFFMTNEKVKKCVTLNDDYLK